MNGKKKCYVIMPVSKTKSCTEEEWTGVFTHMIRPAITSSRLGYECERAKPLTGSFIKDILEGLNRADIVIADLTDRNPNVCYELGIRHTLKNRTIIIAQNIEHVPSDLRSYWVVDYKKDLTGANDFKKKIREILREMQKNPDKSDSPVADFLHLKNININAYEKSQNSKKLTALISETSQNLFLLDEVYNKAKINKEIREKKLEDNIIYEMSRFQTICLDLLLSTHYISLSERGQVFLLDLKLIYSTYNSRLDCWADDSLARNIEERFIEMWKKCREVITEFLQYISKIRVEYINDNYIEPILPPPILGDPKHKEYITSS